MRYQIFIPGTGGADKNSLRKVGLEELIPAHDSEIDCADILKGPGGVPGKLWGWPTSKSVLSFQERHKAVPCVADPVRKLPAGRFWWIFEAAAMPTEEDLRRPEMVDGYFVTFAGQKWNVPNVVDLPQTFGFDESGDVVKVPKPVWKSFVDDAEWALNQCDTPPSQKGESDWKREFTTAVRFLSANYRVNRELVTVLGIIDPNNVMPILANAVDRARLLKLASQLKKEDGAQTPAGSAASAG